MWENVPMGHAGRALQRCGGSSTFVVCLFGSCGCVSREAGRLAVVFGGVVIVKGEFRDVGCGRQNGEFKGLICCRKQVGLRTDLWRQQDWQW